MPTNTTKFEFNKPLVNNATDADLWGTYLNANWDSLDGKLSLTTSSKSADFNVASTEFNYTYLIDASGGTVTATLPAAADVFAGFTVRFKPTDVSNIITLDGNGSETIDGATTRTIDVVDKVVQITCDGSNWQITTDNDGATATRAGTVEKATAAEVLAETADKYPDAALLTNHAGIAKATVHFDGTGSHPITPNNSYNISGTITKNGTGDYTITLSNAMSDANFVVLASGRRASGASEVDGEIQAWATSTTTIDVRTSQSNTNVADWDIISVSVFGDLA